MIEISKLKQMLSAEKEMAEAWNEMDSKEQAIYLAAHPNSKYKEIAYRTAASPIHAAATAAGWTKDKKAGDYTHSNGKRMQFSANANNKMQSPKKYSMHIYHPNGNITTHHSDLLPHLERHLAFYSKRGRGRPRKNPIVTTPTIKRGRGRPKKIVEAPVAVKRGRGRPRINPIVEKKLGTNGNHGINSWKDLQVRHPELKNGSEAPAIKRGRGRPRKIVEAPKIETKNRVRLLDSKKSTAPAKTWRDYIPKAFKKKVEEPRTKLFSNPKKAKVEAPVIKKPVKVAKESAPKIRSRRAAKEADWD
jgi:hypothetical protein